ncbi:DUF6733 family protein [Sandaracinus amylolyticus]|uniref:Uncharacterized protein n=1 Tax=Sandaracinus amylolyticus TaxID=927083 RepID=A0A0F6YMF5_9BACT|nr:DUF6733 family protein [Sandaracinus amylolyticus]AKF09222.1 hypothetical protein DB32_006371 [Sandaracinus amylolyticus]
MVCRWFPSFFLFLSLIVASSSPASAQDEPVATEPTTEPTRVEATSAPETTTPETTTSDTTLAPAERTPVDANAPAVVTVAPPLPRLVRPHAFEGEAIIDTFWGFHVHGRGAIALHEMVDFTVHATLYTSPRLGGASSRTVDVLWVETGIGARAVLLDGALWAGGEIGLMHGALLSDSSEAIPLDGIAVRPYVDARVPLIDHVVGIDGLAQFTVFAPLRQGSGETRTLFHTIARVGAYLFDIVALGPYWEHLFVETAGGNLHPATWLGGYVEARLDFGLVVGAAAGVDLTPDEGLDDGEFYRAWLGWRL